MDFINPVKMHPFSTFLYEKMLLEKPGSSQKETQTSLTYSTIVSDKATQTEKPKKIHWGYFY